MRTISVHNFIKPLKIGNLVFPVNLVAAPLAGYSCAPLRFLLWKYSKPAFTCTEMISCKSLLHRPLSAYRRYLEKYPDDGPTCFQLFGDNAEELGLATKIITDQGADLINLNCGCPVNKVRKQGAGSKLLENPKKIFDLITAMKRNTSLPVSIKIRITAKGAEDFNAEIAQVVNDAGADFLIVHGRHWTEGYNEECHYDQIQFFVENVKVPVIGNGNVSDLASLQKMCATGCAGAMVGRATIGRPWLIAQLVAEASGQVFDYPDASTIGKIFLDHVERLVELVGSEKVAIEQSRKIVGHYARGMLDKKELCRLIYMCDNMNDFRKICATFFG